MILGIHYTSDTVSVVIDGKARAVFFDKDFEVLKDLIREDDERNKHPR